MSTPFPESPNGQRLCEVFGRYPWSFLLKKDDAKDWQTESRYPLRPRLLWKHWQDAAVQIGVRFGNRTRYALIDIDTGSDYLKADKIADLEAALETLGIVRVVKVRSSFSGGLHLYLPLPELVNTFDLAVALKGTVEAHGFKVAEGQLELFPNVKSYGRWWKGEFTEYQGHRLPLQPGSGSALLNESFQPVGATLERFWWTWDFAAQQQDLDLLLQALATGKKNRKRHKRITTPLEQWRSDLEHELLEGWTDFGQTNHLLKQIATYGRVFLSLEGDDLAEFTADKAIGLPGYSQYCRHQHELGRKAKCWARSVEGYYYPASQGGQRGDRHPVEPKSKNGNEERSWDAQRRIRNAIAKIEAGFQELPTRISGWVDAITQLALVSTRTLYRYRELWHPTCKKPFDTAYLSDFEGQNPTDQDSPPENPETPDFRAFLHLGGEMKSSTAENPSKKINFEGERGVTGGREGYPQAFEGV